MPPAQGTLPELGVHGAVLLDSGGGRGCDGWAVVVPCPWLLALPSQDTSRVYALLRKR